MLFDFDRFETLRKETGVTKTKIADALGRTSTIVQDWKAKKSTPSYEQLIIVAKLLHTTPEYLLCETDEKNATPEGDGYSEQELKFLSLYRNDPKFRSMADAMAAAYENADKNE